MGQLEEMNDVITLSIRTLAQLEKKQPKVRWSENMKPLGLEIVDLWKSECEGLQLKISHSQECIA